MIIFKFINTVFIILIIDDHLNHVPSQATNMKAANLNQKTFTFFSDCCITFALSSLSSELS